jgi:uncharacterized protein
MKAVSASADMADSDENMRIDAACPVSVPGDPMLFAFHLLDHPDAGALRQRMRPQHKSYLAQVAERIAFAGPLLADDGMTMVGSLLVIDFPDRASALQWQAQEPFTRAGVYSSYAVHAFCNLWEQRAGFPPAAA